uniref:Senescence regulator n=1 Tax=Betula platyphylla TaxID=78630 RepID=A0A5B9FYI2_BETPL|nr:hypothetical protein [Betula platyphylla]
MAKHLQELQESDVIFPDHDYSNLNNDTRLDYQQMGRHRSNESKINGKRMANSVPVSIPDSIIFHRTHSDDLEEEWDDGEVVPPHVIIGRRIACKMAFSVCTGNGRTLKGRDLSHVRNSILRMTGFLET